MKLTEEYKRGAAYAMLGFLVKYPGQWHSFSTDKITPQIIEILEKDRLITVNHETNQMQLIEGQRPALRRKGV